MKFSRRVYIAGCSALCVAVVQFAVLADANAQQRLGGGGGPGVIGPPVVESVGEPGEKAKPKFEELLENKDLVPFRGYKSEEIPASWKIDGKYLVCDGSGGDLMTKETYGDFELQVDWKIEKGGNSGIMFHVTTGDDAPYMSGPEIQILDDENHADGKSDLTSAGALYGLYPAEGKELRPVGSWNKSRIKVEGDNLVHYLNNDKVLDIDMSSDDFKKRLSESKFKDWPNFAKSKTGHICFQDHGNQVSFRNIRIKRLGDGDDDSGDAASSDGPQALGAPGLGSPRGGGHALAVLVPGNRMTMHPGEASSVAVAPALVDLVVAVSRETVETSWLSCSRFRASEWTLD